DCASPHEKERASCGFDFDFERTNLRRDRSDRRSEVKFERLTKILEGLIFRRPLAGHIDLDALSDEPFVFLPDAGGEFLFHIEVSRTGLMLSLFCPNRPSQNQHRRLSC